MGRGGSSSGRSPNDDRSDVMNPNNDAYSHDQANRFGGDEDWDGGGGGTVRSEYERWADRLMDRIQRNEARRDQARTDMTEAERRYGNEAVPYRIAQEEYREAESRWKATRDGARAYQEAASWWEMARTDWASRRPGEEGISDLSWQPGGVGPEEWARVVALDAAAYALVEARLEEGRQVVESADLALEKAEEAWAAYQDPRVSGEHSDEEFYANEARLREAWDRAYERCFCGQSDDTRMTESKAWAPYEEAKAAYCEAFAAMAVPKARKDWNAAQAAWKAAQKANRPALEALEAASQRSIQESEACSVESRAIDQARRRS
jgi:hypothetical protein